MTRDFTFFDRRTGKIIARYSCDASGHLDANQDAGFIEGHYPEATHVINGRPATPGQEPEADIQSLRNKTVSIIRGTASAKIWIRYPEHRQLNMHSRAIELLHDGEAASPEFAEIRAAWHWIGSIRSAANGAIEKAQGAKSPPELADIEYEYRAILAAY